MRRALFLCFRGWDLTEIKRSRPGNAKGNSGILFGYVTYRQKFFSNESTIAIDPSQIPGNCRIGAQWRIPARIAAENRKIHRFAQAHPTCFPKMLLIEAAIQGRLSAKSA